MKEKSNLPPSLLEHIPWESVANPIWPATTFILHRNLVRYPFPPKMSEANFKQTLPILSEPFTQLPLLSNPTFLPADQITTFEKEFLYEQFLASDSLQNTLRGQGFVVDDSSKFLGLLNIQDHLQLLLIDTQGAWENAWNKLNQIETKLSASLDFAFSPRFGYLTANPALSGTGLVVQAYLHVPAIIHLGQLPETLLKQGDEGITATSLGGTTDEVIGDLLILQNAFTLGVTEENILHAIHSMSMKLMALEKSLRSHLKNEENPEIKDQVCRAFAILLHSYQIDAKEALSALSLMKLGLDLGWIEGVTDAKLTQLLFNCRRAHLSSLIQEPLTEPHEAARKRAEFLHQQMHGIVLKIEAR